MISLTYNRYQFLDQDNISHDVLFTKKTQLRLEKNIEIIEAVDMAGKYLANHYGEVIIKDGKFTVNVNNTNKLKVFGNFKIVN